MRAKLIKKEIEQANTTARHIYAMLAHINTPDFREDDVSDALTELNCIHTVLYSEFIKKLSFNFFNTKLIKDICETLLMITEVNGYIHAKMGYEIVIHNN